jgi:hypothetical protein
VEGWSDDRVAVVPLDDLDVAGASAKMAVVEVAGE